MGRGPTKAELVAEVEALRARVGALELDAVAASHVRKLELAAGPYERRLAILPGLEEKVRLWDARIAVDGELSEGEEAAFKAALAELESVRLDAREMGALERFYRQQAEIIGVLRGRRGGAVSGAKGEPRPGAGVPAEADLKKIGNMVRFGRKKKGVDS